MTEPSSDFAGIGTAYFRLLQRKAWENAEAKGWHEEPRTFGDLIALAHSELSEAIEAYRTHGNASWMRADGKPEGIGPELADVVIRLFDMCEELKIDLITEIETKMAFNTTRPHRHGGKRL